MEQNMKDILERSKNAEFPQGVCCANRCWDCRYLERDNDFYNDGTRRCSWKNCWVKVTDPACYKFSY